MGSQISSTSSTQCFLTDEGVVRPEEQPISKAWGPEDCLTSKAWGPEDCLTGKAWGPEGCLMLGFWAFCKCRSPS